MRVVARLATMASVHTAEVVRRVTSPVFVGRDQELRLLHDAFGSARSAGQLVLVGGDAGVGKTRLVTEACERWRRAGGRAAVGGCIELGATAGFGPLVEVLRALRREVGDDDLDALVASEAPALRPLLQPGRQEA